MRYRNLAAFALCAAACVLFVFLAVPAASVPLASFSVKIDMDEGHGSGSHIGSGFVLTAAHVVDGRAPKVVTSAGNRQDAEILWINRQYDVALLRIHDFDGIAAMPR